MEYSVIVPAFNASQTIRACLNAIFSSEPKDFEVLVVDDKSADQTVAMAKEYPCRVIQLDANVGPARVRERGKKEAQSDILIFIDADIVIKSDTLAQIKQRYARNADIAAVVGILAKDHPNQNFCSIYKNLYMHYVFNRCPDYIDFIYGSFFSIKKECLELPQVLNRYGEDTELGMRLHRKGRKIFLDKNLNVVHLKKYTFRSLIKNDVRIPYYWARLFMRHRGLQKTIASGRFFHAQTYQLVSIILAPIIPLAYLLHPTAPGIAGALFIGINGGFFRFIYQERGLLFTLQAIGMTWLDMFAMGFGIVAGFASCLSGQENS